MVPLVSTPTTSQLTTPACQSRRIKPISLRIKSQQIADCRIYTLLSFFLSSRNPAEYQRSIPHLRESCGPSLLIPCLEHVRRLCLLNHDNPESGPGQPLCMDVVVGFRKPTVWLITLQQIFMRCPLACGTMCVPLCQCKLVLPLQFSFVTKY